MRKSIEKERIFSPTSGTPLESSGPFPYLPHRYGKGANTKREKCYKLKEKFNSNKKIVLFDNMQNPEKNIQLQFLQNIRQTNKNSRFWDHDKINRKGIRHSQILNSIIQILKADPGENERHTLLKPQKKIKNEPETQRNEFIEENEERQIFSVRNNRYPKLVKSDIMKFRLQRKKEADSKSKNRYKTQVIQNPFDDMELTFYRPRPMLVGRKQLNSERRNVSIQHEK